MVVASDNEFNDNSYQNVWVRKAMVSNDGRREIVCIVDLHCIACSCNTTSDVCRISRVWLWSPSRDVVDRSRGFTSTPSGHPALGGPSAPASSTLMCLYAISVSLLQPTFSSVIDIVDHSIKTIYFIISYGIVLYIGPIRTAKIKSCCLHFAVLFTTIQMSKVIVLISRPIFCVFSCLFLCFILLDTNKAFCLFVFVCLFIRNCVGYRM